MRISTYAAAWKQLFDGYLQERASRTGEEPDPFDENDDYRRYVDGRVRQDGVATFLESRGITLTAGEPSDPPDRETVWGLANRKNEAFMATLAERGVQASASSVALVTALRAAGVATAVVSASRNAAQVLAAAGIAGLFDERVDGTSSAMTMARDGAGPSIISARVAACSAVRGAPSKTQPPTVADTARGPRSTATTSSVATSSPAATVAATRSPRAEWEAISVRSRVPADRCDTRVAGGQEPRPGPLPEPDGPSTTIRVTSSP